MVRNPVVRELAPARPRSGRKTWVRDLSVGMRFWPLGRLRHPARASSLATKALGISRFIARHKPPVARELAPARPRSGRKSRARDRSVEMKLQPLGRLRHPAGASSLATKARGISRFIARHKPPVVRELAPARPRSGRKTWVRDLSVGMRFWPLGRLRHPAGASSLATNARGISGFIARHRPRW